MSFLKTITGAAAGFLTGGPVGAVIGGVSGYQASKAEKAQRDAQAQAMTQAQGGIDAQVQAQREGLAAALSGQQISYDLMRHYQQQTMPWQQASLGALQTLPVLQQALGLPSYQLPTSIQHLPEVNFMQEFNQALGQYGQEPGTGVESYPAQSEGIGAKLAKLAKLEGALLHGWIDTRPHRNAVAPGVMPTPAPPSGTAAQSEGMGAKLAELEDALNSGRVNPRSPFSIARGLGLINADGTPTARTAVTPGVMPTPAPPSGTAAQGESTSLVQAQPGQFNMAASPLYQWQKKEVTESLRNQLAAQGLGQSTYGQREESRMRESLAAHERERQVRDMFSMVNIGMGGQPMPTGAEMMPAQAGMGAAQSMANIGAIQGHGAMGMAQMGIDSAAARAAQPPAWMQGLQVAGMFGNMGGMFGGSGSSVPSFGTPPYFPRAANQTMGMMGVPIPIFS